MYCPHCGNESSGELNYCKRCGGNLNPLTLNATQETRPAAVPTRTAWAMGLTMLFLIVFGLVAVFSAVDKLADRVIPPVLVLTVIFGALTVLGGATLLAFLWTRVIGSQRAAAPTQLGRPTNTSELPPSRLGALPDAHFPSVTEHTTRTFDNIRK